MSDFFLRGINDVSAERLRQITEEGYTTEHDDSHPAGELAAAGACYAIHAAFELDQKQHISGVPAWWPFKDGWDPKDPRRNLVVAAAMIIAEIDRYDRAHTAPPPEPKVEPETPVT